MNATITENGNGLPNLGELCYDASTDTVYKIVGWDGSDRISTNGPGCGNSVNVILEDMGSASDTTEEEWDDISSANYGVCTESTPINERNNMKITLWQTADNLDPTNTSTDPIKSLENYNAEVRREIYTLALKRLKSIKRKLAKADEKLPFVSQLREIEDMDKTGPVGVECRRLIATIV